MNGTVEDTSRPETTFGLGGSLLNRRSFFRKAGLAGFGLAGASITAGKLGLMDALPGATALGLKTPSVGATGITDVDILNFALNLEYLEAEFYVVALTGKTLEEYGVPLNGTGNYGKTTGGKRVNFEGRLANIALEIGYDEVEHVLLLRNALGGDAVAKPAIDLDALGIGFADPKEFLQLSRAFEDTGVSAYGGAAPLITSTAYLATAVQIALTEALHSSNVRLQIAQRNIPTTALDSIDVLPPPSGTQYFETNKQGLTNVRTTSEVLAIVYHNSASGTSSGGFFPDGVNGVINTV